MGITIANRMKAKEYYFAQKLRALEASGRSVLNLAIGNPDLPPHASVIEALKQAVERSDVHGYAGYRGKVSLRQACANWYREHFDVSISEGEVLPLIGSKEGIMHLTQAYVNPGEVVACPNPGYPAYADVAGQVGGRVETYHLNEDNGWLPNLDALRGRQIKLMWVNYPHMPTGSVASKTYFDELAHFSAEENVLVVNDNPYGLVLTERPLSLLSAEVPGAHVLELNSLSKCMNMAGWRVGFLIGQAELLKPVQVAKSRMDSGHFAPVHAAAEVAMGLPASWYDGLNETYRKRRGVAVDWLSSLGCDLDKQSAGLFVWAKVPKGWADGEAFSDALLDAGVFIAPGHIFGEAGRPYVRLSLCSPIEKIKAARDRVEKHFKHQTENV